MVIIATLVLAAALVLSAFRIAAELAALRRESARNRTLQIAAMFAPGLAAAQDDPRALLTWQPLALKVRTLFPEEFAALDKASGEPFPFSPERLQAAHARWTADWLAWERAHDAQSKLKAAEAAHDLAASNNAPVMRARCDAVEQDKLESYQRHYEEYIRIAKGLQSLTTTVN